MSLFQFVLINSVDTTSTLCHYDSMFRKSLLLIAWFPLTFFLLIINLYVLTAYANSPHAQQLNANAPLPTSFQLTAAGRHKSTMVIKCCNEVEDTEIGKINFPHNICLPEIVGCRCFKSLDCFDPFGVLPTQAFPTKQIVDSLSSDGKMKGIPNIPPGSPPIFRFQRNDG